MSDSPRPRRVPKTVTVARTESITRDLVRVHFSGAELEPLAYTDHYVKILFPPAGADYRWPFDPEELRETLPREQWPVTRTYTIRSYDPARGELAIDFVVHGDAGLAGPWAATVQPGESIGFLGPGGGWRPNPDADVHLLVGDESALPAIAAALEQLPDGAGRWCSRRSPTPPRTCRCGSGPGWRCSGCTATRSRRPTAMQTAQGTAVRTVAGWCPRCVRQTGRTAWSRHSCTAAPT